MEAPKCKICGKRHYGLCGSEELLASVPEVQEEIREDIPPVRAKVPLTGAERHKRFRDKRGGEYRESNKLRMRKKRDG
jgi:hypothetical protein